MTEAVCSSCGHQIDPTAKLCPYCTADPRTGEKPVDTDALLKEVFRPREISTSESVIEYARQRQGLVVAISVIVLFLALALLHQFVTARNDANVSPAPPVPLTEVTDLSNQSRGSEALELPDLDFAYEGQPQKMKTFIVEAGAIAPPDVSGAPQPPQPQPPARSGPGAAAAVPAPASASQ